MEGNETTELGLGTTTFLTKHGVDPFVSPTVPTPEAEAFGSTAEKVDPKDEQRKNALRILGNTLGNAFHRCMRELEKSWIVNPRQNPLVEMLIQNYYPKHLPLEGLCANTDKAEANIVAAHRELISGVVNGQLAEIGVSADCLLLSEWQQKPTGNNVLKLAEALEDSQKVDELCLWFNCQDKNTLEQKILEFLRHEGTDDNTGRREKNDPWRQLLTTVRSDIDTFIGGRPRYPVKDAVNSGDIRDMTVYPISTQLQEIARLLNSFPAKDDQLLDLKKIQATINRLPITSGKVFLPPWIVPDLISLDPKNLDAEGKEIFLQIRQIVNDETMKTFDGPNGLKRPNTHPNWFYNRKLIRLVLRGVEHGLKITLADYKSFLFEAGRVGTHQEKMMLYMMVLGQMVMAIKRETNPSYKLADLAIDPFMKAVKGAYIIQAAAGLNRSDLSNPRENSQLSVVKLFGYDQDDPGNKYMGIFSLDDLKRFSKTRKHYVTAVGLRRMGKA